MVITNIWTGADLIFQRMKIAFVWLQQYGAKRYALTPYNLTFRNVPRKSRVKTYGIQK